MTRTRASIGLAVALPMALLATACGGPGPSGSAPDASVTTMTQDGVRLVLALSRSDIKAGETIDIAVSATNVGLDELTYESGGCGPTASITVQPASHDVPAASVEQPPSGSGGPAVLGLARWSALGMSSPSIDTIRKPEFGDNISVGCRADLAFDTLAPGATLQDTWQWTARTGQHVPATPGEYEVIWLFPFGGRGTVQTDDMGVPVGRVAIPVQTVLMVRDAGGPTVTLTAEGAIAAAMADPQVLEWADRDLSRETMAGSRITYVDGVWRWRIERPGGGAAEIDVDASTGAVVARRF